jgi:hypothetical protein
MANHHSFILTVALLVNSSNENILNTYIHAGYYSFHVVSENLSVPMVLKFIDFIFRPFTIPDNQSPGFEKMSSFGLWYFVCSA